MKLLLAKKNEELLKDSGNYTTLLEEAEEFEKTRKTKSGRVGVPVPRRKKAPHNSAGYVNLGYQARAKEEFACKNYGLPTSKKSKMAPMNDNVIETLNSIIHDIGRGGKEVSRLRWNQLYSAENRAREPSETKRWTRSYTDVFNRKQEEAISTRKRTRSARIASPRILNNILEQQQFQNRLVELEAKRAEGWLGGSGC